MLPKYAEITDLLKKGATIEAQEKIMELREFALQLQEENLKLKNENLELKQQKKPKVKPKIKYGCYYFDDDTTKLYCASCYDSKGEISLTQRINSKFRKCNVCSSEISSH
jgi:hypothetical protein